MRQLRLIIARQRVDVAEGLAMDTALGLPMDAVGFLEEVDEVMNSSVDDFHRGAEIEAEDAGVAEEPVLRLLGIFGVAERVGDDERGDAAGPQEFVAASMKGT